ncbi:MAG TPA: hypothetical protein VM913_08260 [Sphingomicrobium sp.]|nr:hypothetical protein [Sphingomicrobium sp.]
MRVRSVLLTAGLSVTAAAMAQQRQVNVVAPARILPGARVEQSGFLTIEQAPPSPAPAATARPNRGQNERTVYAELAGISNAEAAKRLREQAALRPTADKLVQQLRTRERGNFTTVEIVHQPDWAYHLYFKRQPEKTLARYTRNPRFKAKWSRYSNSELQKLSQPWLDRLQSERLTTGYGMNARTGTADIDIVVGQEEFAAIAARRGWGKVPEFLNLKFDRSPTGAAVDPAVAKSVRIFPQSDRGLGITNQAGFKGRIFLRDGCFMVDQPGRADRPMLAYFPREVGLYVDPQGYLALRSRTREPRHLGRIGETFSWAGPIGITEEAPMVAELRASCGRAPLMHLSIPESESLFEARYPHLRDPVVAPDPPPNKRN